MLAFLAKFLTGGIVSSLADAYKAKQVARTDQDRIAADKRIALLEGQQAVLVAEQGHWMTRWIRPAFALPFVLYNFKLIVWDKMLGLGATDALSPELLEIEMIMIGAFFLARPFEKWNSKRNR